MKEVKEAYPLSWPTGWKRTPADQQEYSRFKTGFGAARSFLFEEIRRMDGTDVVLSTNIPLRNDGLPRAGMAEPKDRGVAVYFKKDGKDMAFACDQYVNVRDNIYAIAKTIEALRGIERWGASDMMERAFTGFLALPEKASEPWRDILGFTGHEPITVNMVESRFRELARKFHPDIPGNDGDKFKLITAAREQAKNELV